ncbi:U3 small nucleolar RNA-associated protein 3 [Cryptococcus neoformans C23]|uniref:U3 small nucleolar RNA-associated protein 3 n=1 Tax=Cryptococcus neoformans (strain H99 / ATCC 208821 / CBS 10515 / FGSC 9487) TaxID=235443 RepID=J9W350_CRYN9|nr:U3 small nucleolar RNA-associated protein 3 [Cryptococcus neoformans var. grubii H99]AFR98605.1 U3 small nucleolar RNA-associated protein 3 [Cryptococcus neoformans var. grubii H99]AUB28778.1 U3 small nucleolar RNA-associated protein 3 [Cryptococcus neoformans var. grubii]OWZ26932.1 U3 small nucleolar RNA-associated protein 3 [Cryptococcus neoformans var. grubii AD2-60a]OWZ38793.1 U3 small nucleolar RNA-associated protein 3 [Cryptococcus neoformans var. grubii C23]|eukprot:XP_012053445.1 U3 small nucleolar RNA-associated protein 3 [Cryptococcus neoformans var. grubii H99]
MGRKRSGKSGSGASKPSAAPGAKINKMEQYEDTLEPGSVDDFMFKRDKISFNPQDESDDEDINADIGEEVLSLESARRRARQDEYEEEEEGDYSEEEAPIKKRKGKSKDDLSTKGRYGKPIVSSDEEEEEESGSSESEDENWGRQYYARPSNRREKEKESAYVDEKKEEEREMEEREVKRLQKKQREALGGEDFGFDDLDEVVNVGPVKGVESEETLAVPTPPISADPATLLRHLQAHEPLKLALTRDFPLVVQKLQKTSRGIKRMESEDPEDGQLHKGLGWLHYQTLLTYVTTLAFYIHINSLPPSSRPDIPIIPRLLELKQGLTSLEDLDFDAASVSATPLTLYNPLLDWAEGEDEELKEGKAELIKRMQAVNGEDWEDDVDDLWQKEGLEENELEDLLKDADKGEGDVEMLVAKSQKKKKEKKSKKEKKVKKSENDDLEGFDGLDGFDDLDDLEGLLEDEKPKNKSKKSKKIKDSESSSSTAAFAPLAEPEFFTSKSKSKKPLSDESDPLGDPTALTDADASDKSARKRSLAFHTSKINATLARRAEGRANRMGGDEDMPYRDRRKARDDALKRNSVRSEGEDLEEVRAEKEKKKRARDEIEDDGEGVADDDEADGYYELVKRRRKEEKKAKEAEHEAIEEQLLAERAAYDDETADGPRTITRAIEKNRGLTPRRSKTGRNPRVKKRQAYDKAQKKVASQRSVYKGGQAAYGGEYKGEKTGISKVIKSRKF